MAKAEQYIKDYTRNCSNELSNGEYESWLTPDQALRAAEIAKEETIEKACKYINDHWDKLLVYDYNQYGGCVFNRKKTVEQFKKAMEVNNEQERTEDIR